MPHGVPEPVAARARLLPRGRAARPPEGRRLRGRRGVVHRRRFVAGRAVQPHRLGHRRADRGRPAAGLRRRLAVQGPQRLVRHVLPARPHSARLRPGAGGGGAQRFLPDLRRVPEELLRLQSARRGVRRSGRRRSALRRPAAAVLRHPAGTDPRVFRAGLRAGLRRTAAHADPVRRLLRVRGVVWRAHQLSAGRAVPGGAGIRGRRDRRVLLVRRARHRRHHRLAARRAGAGGGGRHGTDDRPAGRHAAARQRPAQRGYFQGGLPQAGGARRCAGARRRSQFRPARRFRRRGSDGPGNRRRVLRRQGRHLVGGDGACRAEDQFRLPRGDVRGRSGGDLRRRRQSFPDRRGRGGNASPPGARGQGQARLHVRGARSRADRPRPEIRRTGHQQGRRPPARPGPADRHPARGDYRQWRRRHLRSRTAACRKPLGPDRHRDQRAAAFLQPDGHRPPDLWPNRHGRAATDGGWLVR